MADGASNAALLPLSITGTILSVGLSLSQLPRVRKVIRHKDSSYASALPNFLVLLNSILWSGCAIFVQKRWDLFTVNFLGAVFTTAFAVVMIVYTKSRMRRAAHIAAVATGYVFTVLLFLILFVIPSSKASIPYARAALLANSITVVVNVLMFAGPLLSVVNAVKTRDASGVPTLLTCVAFLCGLCWMAFGVVLGPDWFVTTPNLIGSLLTGAQLAALGWIRFSKRAAAGRIEKAVLLAGGAGQGLSEVAAGVQVEPDDSPAEGLKGPSKGSTKGGPGLPLHPHSSHGMSASAVSSASTAASSSHSVSSARLRRKSSSASASAGGGGGGEDMGLDELHGPSLSGDGMGIVVVDSRSNSAESPALTDASNADLSIDVLGLGGGHGSHYSSASQLPSAVSSFSASSVGTPAPGLSSIRSLPPQPPLLATSDSSSRHSRLQPSMTMMGATIPLPAASNPYPGAATPQQPVTGAAAAAASSSPMVVLQHESRNATPNPNAQADPNGGFSAPQQQQVENADTQGKQPLQMHAPRHSFYKVHV